MFRRLHIYTVHTKADASSLADSVRFVREGFSVWAFVFTMLWAIYHRAWGFALLIVAANVVLFAAAEYSGLNEPSIAVLQLLFQFWVGFEAHDALRRALRRKGYITSALTSGESEVRAQQRYFDRNAHQPFFAALT